MVSWIRAGKSHINVFSYTHIRMVLKTAKTLYKQFSELVNQMKKNHKTKVNAVFSLALKSGLSSCSLKRTYGLELHTKTRSLPAILSEVKSGLKNAMEGIFKALSLNCILT